MPYPFDDPGIYAIHVAGVLDECWSERLGGLTIVRAQSDETEPRPVTVLIGLLVDQAALAGVLDALYEQGYPLLYVKHLGAHQPSKQLVVAGEKTRQCEERSDSGDLVMGRQLPFNRM